MVLEVKNLFVKIKKNQILKNINLEFEKGKVNILLGKNGSGKSTLLNSIMGYPEINITKGQIFLKGENITKLEPNERAKKGIFLAFQNPPEIEGITILSFLKNSYNAIKNKNLDITQFVKILNKKMKELNLNEEFRNRYLNFGFSGGEKKKFEILQMLLFEPKYIFLDEIDSGLDINSVKLVNKILKKLIEKKKSSITIITHNEKMIEDLKVDNVFVFEKGKLKEKGNEKILKKIHKEGF